MDNIPWVKIVDQRITFRKSPYNPQSWEYSIPAISEMWLGPYRDREIARQEALNYLLQLAQVEFRVSNQLEITHDHDKDQGDLRSYLENLQRQRFELDKMRAALGTEYAEYIDPLVEQVREKIRIIKQSLAE